MPVARDPLNGASASENSREQIADRQIFDFALASNGLNSCALKEATPPKIRALARGSSPFNEPRASQIRSAGDRSRLHDLAAHFLHSRKSTIAIDFGHHPTPH